jgi:hypothetical protein
MKGIKEMGKKVETKKEDKEERKDECKMDLNIITYMYGVLSIVISLLDDKISVSESM